MEHCFDVETESDTVSEISVDSKQISELAAAAVAADGGGNDDEDDDAPIPTTSDAVKCKQTSPALISSDSIDARN